MGYYEISSKERIYLAIRLAISIVIYVFLFGGLYSYYAVNQIPFLPVLLLIIPVSLIILIMYVLQNGLFVGFIKSISVKISDRQLPEIYRIVVKCSEGLHIKVPNVYLLQAGGTLNAFAKKFFTSNYIVIYSDLLEAFYQGDKDAVEFVIAHELGHIKRHHFLKELLLAPSFVIPFLTWAYYRGCELTCDNVGKFFNPKGAMNGLLMLAGGKTIYKELDVVEYMNQANTDAGFWRWLAERFLSHPNLYKRLINVYDPYEYKAKPIIIPQVKPEEVITPEDNTATSEREDHSKYMPR